MARRSKYATHVKPKLVLVEAWSRDGLTLEQIAHNLGISVPTLIKYRDANVEFFDALKRGREVADVEVENALFRNAVGFRYREESVTHTGHVVTLERFMPPQNAAIFFWLKNRRSDKWRDKRDVEHSGKVELADVLTEAWSDDDGHEA